MRQQADLTAARAAIFDLDGTLIDSMEIWREVDEIFFARRNMAVPEGYQEAIAHLGMNECAVFTVERYLPRESVQAIVEEWRALSLERYGAADGKKYFKPGAIELLHRLRGAGMRLCVATASSPELFLPVLRAGGVEELFDAFMTVDEAGKNKSFPDIFLRSSERLGVPSAQCVVFDDNIRALRAAKSAGMMTVGVFDPASVSSHDAMRAEADCFLEDLTAAAKIFLR